MSLTDDTPGAGRIAGAIARAGRAGRVAFIPYIVAGYPDAETSLAAALACIDAGADVLGEHVEAARGELARLAHAFEGGRAVDLDLAGLAEGGDGGVDVGHGHQCKGLGV